MKKIWKVLGVTALLTAVPVRYTEDPVTGERTYESILSKFKIGPGAGGEGTNVSLSLLDGVVPTAIRQAVGKEKADYVDDFEDFDDFDDFDDFEDLGDTPKETVFEASVKVERDLPPEEAQTEETDETTEVSLEET